MDEVRRLQDNLLLIRRSVGWTAEELGEKIGVSRQTINNLEANRNKLSKTQYIAIRAVLDAEMEQSPEDTKMLALILDVFVDHPEKYEESKRKELLDKANMITPSILAGSASRNKVSGEMMTVAGTILGVTMAGAIGAMVGAASVGGWLNKILRDDKT